MFKLFVLSGLVVLAYASPAPKRPNEDDFIEEYSEQCRVELDANRSDVRYLDFKAPLPTNELQRCLLQCLLTKIGHLKDGKLDYDGMIKSIDTVFDGSERRKILFPKLFKACQSRVDKASDEKCASGVEYKICSIETMERRMPPPELD